MGVILPEMRRQRKTKRQEIMRPLCVRIKYQLALVKIQDIPLQCCESVSGGQLITDQAGSRSGSYLSIFEAIEIKIRCPIGIKLLNFIQYFTSF